MVDIYLLARKTTSMNAKEVKKCWCPHAEKIWVVGELQGEDKAKNTIKLIDQHSDEGLDAKIEAQRQSLETLVQDEGQLDADISDLQMQLNELGMG